MKNVLNLLKYFMLLLWSSGIHEAVAQQHQLDSLTILLNENQGAEKKELHLFNTIAQVQVNINPNDALANAEKAIVIAQKLGDQEELAVAYNNKGLILLRKSEYTNAKYFLDKALKVNTDLANPNGIAQNLINAAEILRRQGETDSAKSTLEKALRIYEQSNNLKGKADAYYFLALVNRDLSDFKIMLELCNKAIDIYRLLNDETPLAFAIDAKSVYYYFISDIDSALYFAHIAKEMNEKNNNQYGLAMSYTSMGHMYGELPDFPKSVENHLKALKIYEVMENLERQGSLNVNIGFDYFQLKKYKLALGYTDKGIKQMDERKISNGQYRMALVYMGEIYFELGDAKKSLEYTNRAIQLSLTANDDWALSDAYQCLGRVFLFLGRYYPAILNFNKNLELKNKLNTLLSTPECFIGLGKAVALADDNELLQANIIPAKKNEVILGYFQTALKIGSEAKNNLAQRNALEQLSLFYEKQGEMSKSFAYYKQFIAHKDSISNTDNANAVALLQVQYDTEKKEQQINLLTKESKLQQTELQKQSTNRNVFVAALALAALLAGAVYNRYRIKHNANAAIEQTLYHLKNTQKQLVEQEKLASLGKFTAEVAREIELPLKQINRLSMINRSLMQNIIDDHSRHNEESLKANLLQIYNYGNEADAVVKKVLTETRKLNG